MYLIYSNSQSPTSLKLTMQQIERGARTSYAKVSARLTAFSAGLTVVNEISEKSTQSIGIFELLAEYTIRSAYLTSR